MKFGVIVFPGSNCDIDCFHAVKDILGQEVEYIWHDTKELEGYDCIILRGFSYGDYLRCGAVARFSKIMDAVKVHAAKGKLVIGICNGFQILTEAGLLPSSCSEHQFKVHMRYRTVKGGVSRYALHKTV